MSEDLIARADKVATKLRDGRLDWQEYKAIVPELIAEIKRLRSEVARINRLREQELDKIAREIELYEQFREAKDARIAELDADRRLLLGDNAIIDYIKRLEEAFLKSETARLDNPDRSAWYPDDETYINFLGRVKQEAVEGARAALERIKEGKG
jgi:hypothetical protein